MNSNATSHTIFRRFAYVTKLLLSQPLCLLFFEPSPPRHINGGGGGVVGGGGGEHVSGQTREMAARAGARRLHVHRQAAIRWARVAVGQGWARHHLKLAMPTCGSSSPCHHRCRHRPTRRLVVQVIPSCVVAWVTGGRSRQVTVRHGMEQYSR